MRCAFFAATDHGIVLGRQLREGLACSVDIYVKASRANGDDLIAYEKMAEAVAKAFKVYDALVFCTAAGIAVRMLAPLVQSKLSDPAVVVVDEQARHAISLLSGHVGGGNELTLQVAAILGAEPVITTATDVNHTIAPDAVAGKLGLYPYPKSQIQVINSALLEGKKPAYWIDKAMERAAYWKEALLKQDIRAELCELGDLGLVADGLTVFLTDHRSADKEGILYLTPRRLIAGVGCRRDTPQALIKKALLEACRRIGQDIEAISMLASTVVKSDEAGLLAMAAELGREIKFFENEALQAKIEQYGLEESAFVKKQIGVGNISASAALCCVDRGSIALDKTKFEKVTVALVWEK